MIIGNGLIASSFKKRGYYERFVIFSSGVSNSKEVSAVEFDREKRLLLETLKKYNHLKFIYFSTVVAPISNTKYCQHKLEIEGLIKKKASSYVIFRVPQLVGPGGNKNNLLNYISQRIHQGQQIKVGTNVERSLMCVDDMVKIVDYCKDRVDSSVVTISGIEKMKVFDICHLVGSILDRTPDILLSDDVSYDDWDIPNSDIVEESLLSLGISPKGYTERVLLKHLRIKV